MSLKRDASKRGNVLPCKRKRHAFTRMHRLSQQNEFKAILREHSSRIATNCFVVYHRRNSLEYPRLGIIVPRAVGSAPKRNSIKRSVRETFRLLYSRMSFCVDIVVIVKKNCAGYTQQSIAGELANIWKKCGII